jgi:hypothetical protein
MLGESGYFWMAVGWPAHRCVEESGDGVSWTCETPSMARIEEVESRGIVYDQIWKPWEVDGWLTAITSSVYYERLTSYTPQNSRVDRQEREAGRWMSAMCVTHETPYGEMPDGESRWERGRLR